MSASSLRQPMRESRRSALSFVIVFVCIAAFIQAAIVVHARPQDLITGAHGIADILRRSWPPDIAGLPDMLWPALETIDIALFGTAVAVIFALPLALLAARNTTPATPVYVISRMFIALARVVPDLVWALIFVTAVGLGPFPGTLAIMLHSIGMLGRLFSEVIEDMDMGPVEALTMTGASRMAVFSHAVVPTVIRRCSASRSIASTRISAPPSCSASSAPAALASCC
jgi:phosphonate transport system permease protein